MSTPRNGFIRPSKDAKAMQQNVIPFANPHAAYALRRQAIIDAVVRSLDSGQYILGAEVAAFENAFAAYLGVASVVGCASGTDALELALRGMGAGPGKAVFTVAHTAVATVAAICRAGAVPVLVDIEPDTFTMSPRSLALALEHLRTSQPEMEPAVIIPVHLYGHPCDMDPILELARQYGCQVLEDCAQAHGARYKGKMVGSMGRAAAFSFYPTKNLGALGDAGGVATNDPQLAETLRVMRQYGWQQRYISAVEGINSRLDPAQAAILAVQLEFLDADNAARRSIAALYDRELAGCALSLPQASPWAQPVYHLYVVRCPHRDQLAAYLKERGIGTAVHYPVPVHLQPAYAHCLCAPGGLRHTEAAAAEILSLPMFPQLDNQAAEFVVETIRRWQAEP